MSTIFDQIQVKKPSYSKFDLSHEKKLSFNMGDIIPIMLEEVLPGDSFKVKSEIMIRLAPMLAPIMHRVNVYTHYFYVPNRLVWENFHEHITGGDDGTSNPPHPFLNISESSKTEFLAGSLADYYGIPPVQIGTTVDQDQEISSLPFRGHALIYNEYYRDQNLQAKIPIYMGDGSEGLNNPDWPDLLTIRQRAWEKDYFTSCLKTAQKGPSVSLPIEGTFDTPYLPQSQVDTGVIAADQLLTTDVTNAFIAGGTPAVMRNLEDTIDLTSTGVNINELRKATRLQEWLELANRGGSRISEIIRNFFGVTPDDLRILRPQYLGGGKQPIIISEVLNTAGTTDPGVDPTSMQPVGEMAGHGISSGGTNSFSHKFKEHGYIHGFISVIPKTVYQTGIPRHFNKFDKFDKAWPQFAQLGEQEVLNKELYVPYNTSQGDSEGTFGYQSRYAEYKYGVSTVHGDFRQPSQGGTLDYWHMAREFEDAIPPALNSEFIKADPTHRIFAVTDETQHKLWCQIYNKVSAVRPLPYFNDPTL